MSTLTDMPIIRGDFVYINGKQYTKAEAFPAYMQAYAGIVLPNVARQENQFFVYNHIKELDYNRNKSSYAADPWQIFLDFFDDDVDK